MVLWCYIWSRAEKGAVSRWGAGPWLGLPPPRPLGHCGRVYRLHLPQKARDAERDWEQTRSQSTKPSVLIKEWL